SSFVSRLPPASTFFPYATLFRSAGELGHRFVRVLPDGARQSARARALLGGGAQDHAGDHHAADLRRLLGGLPQGAHALEPRRWLDRKSTRLNSSHVKISYAVFCL